MPPTANLRRTYIRPEAPGALALAPGALARQPLGSPMGSGAKRVRRLGLLGPAGRAASEPGKAALLWQSSLWVRLVTLTRLPLPDPVLTPNPDPHPNPNPNPRLSLPDLVLAAKIDAIEVECSPKWLKEQAAAAAAAH